MKLSIFLVVLCIGLGVDAAAASGRPSGKGHSRAIRNSVGGRNVKNKYHYGSYSSPASRNRTSYALPQDYGSGRNVYSNNTFPSSVASHWPQATPSRSHYRHRRGPTPTLGYHSSGLLVTESRSPADITPQTISYASVSPVKHATKTNSGKRSPLKIDPTPAPTASGSPDKTVFINDVDNFALLLPNKPDELISDAESDGVAFCTPGKCSREFPDGFITAAAVTRSPDRTSWIQITGCIDPSKTTLSTADDGGQFDVRFPNGAQCTFGGYGASFIEQVEPSANRFCLRCCSNANDQTNCNSHQDRAGCPVAIPGTYDFPDKGVSCA